MKKSKKFLSVLCAVCMVMAMAAPAMAASNVTRSATESTKVTLSGGTQKIFDFPVARGYGYWKIFIQNTNSAECWFTINKGSPSGDVVYTSANVPSNDSLAFRSDSGDPLPDGTYYVTVHSSDTGKNLDGTLWYKFGTTYEDVAD